MDLDQLLYNLTASCPPTISLYSSSRSKLIRSKRYISTFLHLFWGVEVNVLVADHFHHSLLILLECSSLVTQLRVCVWSYTSHFSASHSRRRGEGVLHWPMVCCGSGLQHRILISAGIPCRRAPPVCRGCRLLTVGSPWSHGLQPSIPCKKAPCNPFPCGPSCCTSCRSAAGPHSGGVQQRFPQ